MSRVARQRAEVEQPDWGGPYVPPPPLKPSERQSTLQTALAQADYWRVRCVEAEGALRSARAELELDREARRAAEHARDSATTRASEATAALEALYRSGGPLMRARVRLAMAGKAALLVCVLLAPPVEAAQLTLSWVDNSANETSFRVDRAPSESGPWAPVGFAPLGRSCARRRRSASRPPSWWSSRRREEQGMSLRPGADVENFVTLRVRYGGAEVAAAAILATARDGSSTAKVTGAAFRFTADLLADQAANAQATYYSFQGLRVITLQNAAGDGNTYQVGQASTSTFDVFGPPNGMVADPPWARAATAVDSTVDQTLQVAAQWSHADASNSITVERVEVVRIR